MRHRLLVAGLFALAPLCPAAAHAANITYAINFSATGATPASGSFILTFDPTQSYALGATSGLTVNQLSFNSGPSGFGYLSFYNLLRIGGLLNGVNSEQPGTDDYQLQILDFTTGAGATLTVTQAGTSNFVQYDNNNTHVNITQVATTPEPSSLVLLLSGLTAVGVSMRRRLRVSA